MCLFYLGANVGNVNPLIGTMTRCSCVIRSQLHDIGVRVQRLQHKFWAHDTVPSGGPIWYIFVKTSSKRVKRAWDKVSPWIAYKIWLVLLESSRQLLSANCLYLGMEMGWEQVESVWDVMNVPFALLFSSHLMLPQWECKPGMEVYCESRSNKVVRKQFIAEFMDQEPPTKSSISSLMASFTKL